jgi:hypothetical protein
LEHGIEQRGPTALTGAVERDRPAGDLKQIEAVVMFDAAPVVLDEGYGKSGIRTRHLGAEPVCGAPSALFQNLGEDPDLAFVMHP